jgi:hypothetical protein
MEGVLAAEATDTLVAADSENAIATDKPVASTLVMKLFFMSFFLLKVVILSYDVYFLSSQYTISPANCP